VIQGHIDKSLFSGLISIQHLGVPKKIEHCFPVSIAPVKLGSLAAQSLAASEDPDPERLSLLLPRAVRFYLEERDGGQPGWRYPSFLAGRDSFEGEREVALEEELWQQLQAEAERQEVAPENLLQHAAFYYGAARDEGRLTQRIAAELRREEEGGGGS